MALPKLSVICTLEFWKEQITQKVLKKKQHLTFVSSRSRCWYRPTEGHEIEWCCFDVPIYLCFFLTRWSISGLKPMGFFPTRPVFFYPLYGRETSKKKLGRSDGFFGGFPCILQGYEAGRGPHADAMWVVSKWFLQVFVRECVWNNAGFWTCFFPGRVWLGHGFWL